MTKDEALKMAIEWAEGWYGYSPSKDALLKACRKALEQPAQEPVACHCGNPAFNLQSITHTKTKCFQKSLQKPVAWTDKYEMFLEFDKEILCDKAVCKEHEAIPLYTHPHQWQGLTDDEIDEQIEKASIPQYQEMDVTATNLRQFAKNILNIVKVKNYG